MNLLALLVVVVPWELPIIFGIAYVTRQRWLGRSRILSNYRFIGCISPLSLLVRLIANRRNRGASAPEEGGICHA